MYRYLPGISCIPSRVYGKWEIMETCPYQVFFQKNSFCNIFVWKIITQLIRLYTTRTCTCKSQILNERKDNETSTNPALLPLFRKSGQDMKQCSLGFLTSSFLRYGRSTMNAANGTPVLQATCGLGQHLNGLSEDNRSVCSCHLFNLLIHFFEIRNMLHFTNNQQTFFPL